MESYKDVASKAAAVARERREESKRKYGLSHRAPGEQTTRIGSSVAAAAALAARQRTTEKEDRSQTTSGAKLNRTQSNTAKAAARAAAAVAVAKKYKNPPPDTEVKGSALSRAVAAKARDCKYQNVLVSLILSFEWQTVPLWCSTHPEDAKYVDPVTGSTPLHLICATGSAPPSAVISVLDAWVGAVLLKNRRYGETPLHLQCRNSQMTTSKTAALIQKAPEAVSILNKEGQSPLHVACQSNAMFPILQMLVKASPSMLSRIDRFGGTPLAALWGSYGQSIPGQLALCRVKMGLSCEEGHFDRFWTKAVFIALETYKHFCETNDTDVCTINDKLLAHAIICIPNCPRLMLDVALNLQPDLASAMDSVGNYPLHSVLLRRLPLEKQRSALKLLLELFGSAAKVRDHEGVLPLHRAIKAGVSWDQGLSDVMKAAPDALDLRERESCLYPFMLAASVNEFDSLSDSFSLLSARPELVGCAALDEVA